MPLSLDPLAIRIVGPLCAIGLLAAGCATNSLSHAGSSIHESARGSVFLQEALDRSFHADHPAVIDPSTLLGIVKSIVAESVKNLSPTMPAGGSKPMNVFSDEDAEFLAPLLAQGLSQAKPDQMVGFTVSSSAGSGTEPAAGTLYRYRGDLYLTIVPTEHRRISGVMPNVAARIERAPAYMSEWIPGTTAIVIDPHGLAKTHSSDGPRTGADSHSLPDSGTPAAPSSDAASSRNELQAAYRANKLKDSEISALRKEVERMKQELHERSATTGTVSQRTPGKRKSAEASPSR